MIAGINYNITKGHIVIMQIVTQAAIRIAHTLCKYKHLNIIKGWIKIENDG